MTDDHRPRATQWPSAPGGANPNPARRTSPRASRTAGLFLAGLVLYTAGYYLWWPLLFVALSPVAVGFCRLGRGWHAVLVGAVVGWAGMVAVHYPLWTFSFPAVAVLAAYQSLTWIPVAVAVRAVWRRWRWPMTFAWPLAWTAGECLRALGPLGSPGGILALPNTDPVWMLQTADLGGIHLVSLPIAMVQGWLADVLLLSARPAPTKGGPVAGAPPTWRRLGPATAGLAAVWLGVAAYGKLRLAHIESQMIRGPRLAVIQTDIPAVRDAPLPYDPALLIEKLQRLSEQAASSPHPPQLIVWPESITGLTIPNRAYLEARYDPRMAAVLGTSDAETAKARWDTMRRGAVTEEKRFANWVSRLGVPVLVGMSARVPSAAGSATPFDIRNAAVLFRPGTGQSRHHQAKVKLYPGGEYLPGRGTVLEHLVPAPAVDLTPGEHRRIEKLTPGGPGYTVSICSEMMFPHLQGERPPPPEGHKPWDYLIAVANEGLFLRNRCQIALPNCSVFRAIESRTGIARSSNAGVSGFFAPTGRRYGTVTNHLGQTRTGLGAPELDLIKDLLDYREENQSRFATDPAARAELQRRIREVETVRARAGVEGYSVDHVYLASGPTVFQRVGDWLPPALSAALALMVVAPSAARRRVRVAAIRK